MVKSVFTDWWWLGFVLEFIEIGHFRDELEQVMAKTWKDLKVGVEGFATNVESIDRKYFRNNKVFGELMLLWLGGLDE